MKIEHVYCQRHDVVHARLTYVICDDGTKVVKMLRNTRAVWEGTNVTLRSIPSPKEFPPFKAGKRFVMEYKKSNAKKSHSIGAACFIPGYWNGYRRCLVEVGGKPAKKRRSAR